MAELFDGLLEFARPMPLKHRLKLVLREVYARFLFHTGLHALVDRAMPPRLTILAGHCVKPANGEWPAGEMLPPDMSIPEVDLERLLRWFARRYELVTVGEGVERLERGLSDRKSLVALSMDDGYRDNASALLPLLKRVGATATIYLETRPLDERRVNWSHKYFWILARTSAFEFAHAYGEHCAEKDTYHALNQIVAEDRGDARYHMKRVLKYDADPVDRDAAIDAVFVELGGDERELADALYMTWDDARALAFAGIELGGHTHGHPILARLDPSVQRREIEGGRASMARELGAEARSFAYPWGRRWDFDPHSARSARECGFRSAVTMHAGTNGAATDRYALKRLAIDGGVALHVLAAEACGGFELLRRFGIDLSE
jgi:peptidoglycan/xylan/chitin deacetylase (PgdA/CDA1 family)